MRLSLRSLRWTLLAVVASLACESRRGGPVVVLVTLDTTRADVLGVYGDPDARTPTLDAWARSGAVVRWAIADVPLTLPSHATIMTSVPAVGHGVRTNVHFRLGDDARTLSEELRDAGFRTFAVVSTRVLGAATGIAQGFDQFDDAIETPAVPVDPARYAALDPGPPTSRRAQEAVDLALRIFHESHGPSFVWLHLFDAHTVYDPPHPWERLAPDLYRAEVAAMDAQLRRLDRGLDELDRRGPVALAVTADHGEGLDDHHEDEHGFFVYDEAVRVPLILRGQGVPTSRILDEQVRTIDVAPTLLELARVPASLGLGGSLVPALTGRGPVPSPTAYCESMTPKLSQGASSLKALRTRSSKFVWAPEPELYDLIADPGERRNVADATTLANERAQLAGVIRGIREASQLAALAPTRSDEDRERLRSLGYAGADGPAHPPTRAPLEEELAAEGLDPKWIVDVAMAGRDLDVGRQDRARRKLERFLTTAPAPAIRPDLRPIWSVAYQNLALLALQSGDANEAVDRYGDALRFAHDNVAAEEGRVKSLNLAGRPEQAVREADAFLAERGDEWTVRMHRALGLALEGRGHEARSELEALASRATQEDRRAMATFYVDRLGTAQEAEVLRAYLESH